MTRKPALNGCDDGAGAEASSSGCLDGPPSSGPPTHDATGFGVAGGGGTTAVGAGFSTVTSTTALLLPSGPVIVYVNRSLPTKPGSGV